MSLSPSKALDLWIPRLLAVWRKSRRQEDGPKDRLTPKELKEVAAGVRQLSLGLTRDRHLAGARYMDDAKLLGAYLLFYWPVSYAQGRQALGELPRPRSVLDLGSGPGPLGFAALDAGAQNVTCADRSKAALQLAKDLALEAEEAISTREWDPQKATQLPDGPFDFITAGHVFNELFGQGDDALSKRAHLAETLLKRLKPNGTLLLLEPALRETSRNILRVRDVLVQKGFAVRAPCLWKGNCPALLKESDWCHAERMWRMPTMVEDIAKAAGLHKEALKFTYLAFAATPNEWPVVPEGRLFRIVSEPLEGKGRQRYMGCGPEGRLGLALQEKHRQPHNEAFFRLNRGDVISMGATEPKGDGLGLNENTDVKVLAPAGSALLP